MANRMALGICEKCGAKYLKCRFNKLNQKYCTRKNCVTKRRQERQRQRYRSTYRNDQKFADAERERCRKGIRKRREDARQTADEAATDSAAPRINMNLFATGLLSQWIDSNDPVEVGEAARRLERRGQQLAIATIAARGSPILEDFTSVPLHPLEPEKPVPLHPL